MDETKVPIGFGMALAMNAAAMKEFASMTEAKQETVLQKARRVSSKEEMHRLVTELAGRTEDHEVI